MNAGKRWTSDEGALCYTGEAVVLSTGGVEGCVECPALHAWLGCEVFK